MSDDQNNIPMWKPKDIETWLKSGEIQKDLIVGPHTIEFKDIESYDSPEEETLLIDEDKTLTVLKKYTRYIPKGSLIIKILPTGFSDIVNVAWRIKDTDYWRPSLYVEEKVLVGEYEIEFKDSQFCKARERLIVEVLDKKLTEVEYTFFTAGIPIEVTEELAILTNTNLELRKRTAPEVINISIFGAEGVIEAPTLVGKYGEPLEIFLQGSYVFNYHTLMDKITSTVPLKFKFPHKIVTESLYENGSITFDIAWFSDIKEDLYITSNTLTRGRQVDGIFTREAPYIGIASIEKIEKRKALKVIELTESIGIISDNIINNTKRQFIQRDDLEDQPTIASDIILSATKDNREKKVLITQDELAIVAPVVGTLTKRKTLKNLEVVEELIYTSGLLLDSYKKAVLKLNLFQEDTIYSTVPNIIAGEKTDPSINIYKIIETNDLSVNANTSIALSKFNHKIKRDINVIEDSYISSNSITEVHKQQKFTFINMNEEPYIAANSIESGFKQTKMLVNTFNEDSIYNNLVTVAIEKKSNLNKVLASKEDAYVSSGTVLSGTLRNDFLIKQNDYISSIYVAGGDIIACTKENLAIKKTKFEEGAFISATTLITDVEKHDPRFNVSNNKTDGPYFNSGEILIVETRSFVKDIYFVDLDPTYLADYISSCEKRKNLEKLTTASEDIIIQGDFIYAVDKYSKVSMFPYVIDNDAMVCLISDDVLYGAKKSHLLKEPEDFNDLVINSIITLEAFTKSHLLKVNATNEDSVVISDMINNAAIKSHLLKDNSSALDPTINSDVVISGTINNIYNTNIHLEESYITANSVTLAEIKDKFFFNTQLEDPYISSDMILQAEKQVP